MATKKELDYMTEKAIWWERECIQTKKCLFAITLEAAKQDTNERLDPIDFSEIKDILFEHGFLGFYREALAKLEGDK